MTLDSQIIFDDHWCHKQLTSQVTPAIWVHPVQERDGFQNAVLAEWPGL